MKTRSATKSVEARKRTRVRRMSDRELERSDWIAVARRALIEEGVGAVRVERLAKTLGVTRGGFYWRFRNLEELLDALIEQWRSTSSHALIEASQTPGDLSQRFDAMVNVYVNERGYSPEWDTAMREWGRVSPQVAEVVHAVDDARIAAIQAMFADAGLSAEVAMVRARIIYYHQVGYYAMGVHESRERRRHLIPIYKAVLTGLGPQTLLSRQRK